MMNNPTLDIDSGIKLLTELCLKNKNYQKLCSAYLLLIGNEVDKTGIRLGVRARDKTKREPIYKHMALINDFLMLNLRMTIFKEDLVNKIKKTENKIIRQELIFSTKSCAELVDVYYDLRKISIPNIYKSEKLSELPLTNNLRAFKLMGDSSDKKDKKVSASDKLKPLILQKIKNNQRKVQKEVEKTGYREGLLERSLRLKEAEKFVKGSKGEKTKLEGKLRDNLQYQMAVPDLAKYFILSIVIFFGLLGMIMGIEAATYANAIYSLSLIMMLFFGACIVFFVMYYNLYEQEE